MRLFVAYLAFAAIPLHAAAQCVAPAFRAPVRSSVAADEVVRTADLDGDGAIDIITSGNQVDELSTFSVLRNLGTGAFAPEQQIESGFGERIEDVSDLNGDGIADLLVSNYWQNGIAMYRGLGSLHFSSGTPFATATHGGPSRAVDYDSDGRTDVVSFSFGSAIPFASTSFADTATARSTRNKPSRPALQSRPRRRCAFVTATSSSW